jgi:hypothetical protein
MAQLIFRSASEINPIHAVAICHDCHHSRQMNAGAQIAGASNIHTLALVQIGFPVEIM